MLISIGGSASSLRIPVTDKELAQAAAKFFLDSRKEWNHWPQDPGGFIKLPPRFMLEFIRTHAGINPNASAQYGGEPEPEVWAKNDMDEIVVRFGLEGPVVVVPLDD